VQLDEIALSQPKLPSKNGEAAKESRGSLGLGPGSFQWGIVVPLAESGPLPPLEVQVRGVHDVPFSFMATLGDLERGQIPDI
jgi:hypothetical protein